MKAYHVTPADNMQSILSNGLVPSIGGRSMDLGETVPSIYLFSSEDALIDGLGNWLGEYFEDVELAVFEVDTDGFIDHSTVEYEVVIYETIPVHRIRFVRFE